MNGRALFYLGECYLKI